jgi:hypothetical protein
MRQIILEFAFINEPISLYESSIYFSLIFDFPSFINTLMDDNLIAILILLYYFFDKDTSAMLNTSAFNCITVISSIDHVKFFTLKLAIFGIHFGEFIQMLWKIKRIICSIIFNEFIFWFKYWQLIRKRDLRIMIFNIFIWKILIFIYI